MIKTDGALSALQKQRDQALFEVVSHAGQIAELLARLSNAEKLISSLTDFSKTLGASEEDLELIKQSI